jgi:hypothetical protein
MSRIQYHREHKAEPEVKNLLEQEAVDCALEDDEETEQPERREAEPVVQPVMVEETEGLDGKPLSLLTKLRLLIEDSPSDRGTSRWIQVNKDVGATKSRLGES